MPKLIIELIMTNIIEIDNTEAADAQDIQGYNRMWGNEFILMDSVKFLGGPDGTKYDNVIEILLNVRNTGVYS